MESYKEIILTSDFSPLLPLGFFFFFFFYLKNKYFNLLLSRDLKKNQTLSEDHICFFHPKSPATAVCSICEHSICELCTVSDHQLNFCKEHFELYSQTEWKIILSAKTNAENSKMALHIYEFKKNKWCEKIPSYIKTQYSIDSDPNTIDSIISLYIPIEYYSLLKKRIDLEKGKKSPF